MTPRIKTHVSGSIQRFAEALETFPQRLARDTAAGRRYIGWFCTYTPLEIIHAAGFTPLRITAGGAAAEKADLLTPQFLCPFLRRAVAWGLESRFDSLWGFVQGYTCDAACGTAGIWEENFPGRIFHSLPLPYNDSPEARAFCRDAMGELADRLNTAGGAFSDEHLHNALVLYGRLRRLLLDLHDIRSRGNPELTASAVLTATNAAFALPPGDAVTQLEELLSHLPEHNDEKPRGIPVLVSGSVIEDGRILDILENCGGTVVADDLCSGRRGLVPPNGDGASPLDRLVDRYMRRAPCPARSRAEDRADCLAELIEQSAARGVVFILQKFCTPHLADLPMLTSFLKEKGIPSLVVEMEETGFSEGQLRTRFESFFEMIG